MHSSKANPYNPAFATTMTFVNDFFNIPPYAQLLEVSNREFSSSSSRARAPAQETMDTMAAEFDKILKAEGFIQ